MLQIYSRSYLNPDTKRLNDETQVKAEQFFEMNKEPLDLDYCRNLDAIFILFITFKKFLAGCWCGMLLRLSWVWIPPTVTSCRRAGCLVWNIWYWQIKLSQFSRVLVFYFIGMFQPCVASISNLVRVILTLKMRVVY